MKVPEKTLEKLHELYTSVLGSPHSDFYNQKYAKLSTPPKPTTTWWQSLPYLTREEIMAVPLFDRLYIEDRDLEMIRLTSGTSGKNVLVVPRNQPPGSVSELYDMLFEVYPFTRLASFASASFRSVVNYKRTYGAEVISLPLSNMAAATNMIKKFEPDALFGFGYAVEAVSHKLSVVERELIKVIQLFGERTSKLRLKLLKEQFPNAVIISEYSSIDAQTMVGLQCLTALENDSTAIHPFTDTVFCELIDPDTEEIITEPDRSGELVLTVIQKTAFPLIRYRTGDAARIITHNCACGIESPLIFIEGRLHDSKARFRGGELQLDEIERAVDKAVPQKNITIDRIELTEEATARGIKPRLVLSLNSSESVITDSLAEVVSKNLRVAPGKTYQDAVAENLLLPLSLKKSEQTVLQKAKGIITNL